MRKSVKITIASSDIRRDSRTMCNPFNDNNAYDIELCKVDKALQKSGYTWYDVIDYKYKPGMFIPAHLSVIPIIVTESLVDGYEILVTVNNDSDEQSDNNLVQQVRKKSKGISFSTRNISNTDSST